VLRVVLTDLKKIRKDKNLSFQQFKIKGGLDKSVVYNIESGQSIPRIDTVCKLAKAMMMEPVALFAILIKDEKWAK
jgi:transcriptional regulator with XRE-family HTH domain